MSRLLTIGTSLAIVLLLYWTYALVAVPIIEPPTQRRSSGVTAEQRARVRQAGELRQQELAAMFSPGSWELDNPTILESDQVKLLLKDYVNRDDGAVELHPCTMIFTPNDPDLSEAERKRRAVILEAPQGAVLQFDRAFDLSSANIGRPESGHLIGPVTIRSEGKLPGPEDNMLVVTSELQVTKSRIWTKKSVHFKMGFHYGQGREMELILDSDDDLLSEEKSSATVAGFETFKLVHLDRLHLEFPKQADSSGNSARATDGQRSKKLEAPIEVTCRGPFLFDMRRQMALFQDQVQVVQVHVEGLIDRMRCRELAIFFEKPETPRDTSEPRPVDSSVLNQQKASGGSPASNARGQSQLARDGASAKKSRSLRPSRLEARGQPVVIEAPSFELHAVGELLEYDFKTGSVLLSGLQKEVALKRQTNEIHARKLQYTPMANRLGQIVAEGPGWLRGSMQKQSDQPLEARWSGLLQVRPDQQVQPGEHNQVISMTGQVSLRSGELGELDGREIHLFLLEAPLQQGEKQPKLLPQRMVALGDVQLRSDKLKGRVEELKVWFKPIRQTPVPSAMIEGPSSAFQPISSEAPLAGNRAAKDIVSTKGDSNASHFDIQAQRLQVEIETYDGKGELSGLTMEGNVRLTEISALTSGELPLRVEGEHVEVIDANNRTQAAITVTGAPARFEGRGLKMTGSNINMNNGTNRIWIDGSGSMVLPPMKEKANPNGEKQFLSSTEPINIEWQDSMTFDGSMAVFEESVWARSKSRFLRTETLEVAFKNPINFSANSRSQPKTEPKKILCRGGVFIENRSFQNGVQASIERIEVADLAIDLSTGVLAAAGPGWVSTVRRGWKNPTNVVDPSRASAQPALVSEPDDRRLTYLNVQFQGSISGNIHTKDMTFLNQIQATYGPVNAWDAKLESDDPDALDPGGVLVNCDQLSVSEMSTLATKQKNIELEALGNVLVQGRTYTARASRMAYTDAKGRLILEGNGRADAELFYQKRAGMRRSEFFGRKLEFWPREKRLKVDGARSALWN